PAAPTPSRPERHRHDDARRERSRVHPESSHPRRAQVIDAVERRRVQPESGHPRRAQVIAVIHGLYTAALGATLLAAAPAVLYRRVSRGVPIRLGPRLGYGPARRTSGPCGWIHAVSVGESIAAAPIVDGLRRVAPSLPLVMTTVTETGARIVAER